jgi:hypothetical protein
LPGLLAAAWHHFFSPISDNSIVNEQKQSHMTDQKNKQQQPQQGNKQNSSQSGQGHQSQGHQPKGNHSSDGSQSKSGKAKTAMPDSDEDPVREADFGGDKTDTEINDNPEETKKKIPNMQHKH